MTEFEKENLRFTLQNKKILLGITGSIAAFKACDLVRLLRGLGSEVRVVLTHGAANFVSPLTLETLSGHPVLTDFWGTGHHGTHHIDTARWADLVLVAPATANILAKMAGGFADDLLTTELLAFTGPVWIAPAMNPAMFAHPAVQRNLALLRERAIHVLGPTSGATACGEEGLGRMMEPAQIIREVATGISARESSRTSSGASSGTSGETLAGVLTGTLAETPERRARPRSILITLGPTRSALDPVRYLTNRSSGLMGAALAWAAAQAGHRVSVVCGPTQAPLPPGIEIVPVTTNSQMLSAVQERWAHADVFMATAAVLDWEIETTAPHKLKREEGTPAFALKKGADVLQWVCDTRQPSQFVLGFAAETHLPVENGLNKLNRKKCNALFVNDVSLQGQGFESTENEGWWITPKGPAEKIEKTTKNLLARRLLSLIEERLN